MGPLGWQETLVIFVLVLLLFGPKKLPEVGRNIAKAINEFRRASNELRDTWPREMTNLERETAEIKKEADSLAQATSDYNYSSNYDYNYDSSYDYGSYGYPESYDTPSTTDANPVSDSATQDADKAGAGAEATVAAGEISPPVEAAPPAEPAPPQEAASGEPAVR
jgi:sec-independent protein translocase protein TatA